MTQTPPHPEKDPRQRILEAALQLFSKKGYAAVGVREITAAADVNISMISYYFKGKVGILKTIMEEFFQRYLQVFDVPDRDSKSPEICAHEVLGNIVRFVRENLDLALVAYNELPLEVPEIAELKMNSILQMIERAGWLIERFGLDTDDRLRIGVIGPTLFSMIMMHFRIRSIQRQLFGFQLDDAFYERFTQTAAAFFLDGIRGMAAPPQSVKGHSHE